MPDLENFPDSFYASDREAAKGHAGYPLTLEYIERLEVIAKAAEVLLRYVYNPNDKEAKAKSDDLNNALAMVNFLDESL
jgi:hypothetical protein